MSSSSVSSAPRTTRRRVRSSTRPRAAPRSASTGSPSRATSTAPEPRLRLRRERGGGEAVTRRASSLLAGAAAAVALAARRRCDGRGRHPQARRLPRQRLRRQRRGEDVLQPGRAQAPRRVPRRRRPQRRRPHREPRNAAIHYNAQYVGAGASYAEEDDFDKGETRGPARRAGRRRRCLRSDHLLATRRRQRHDRLARGALGGLRRGERLRLRRHRARARVEIARHAQLPRRRRLAGRSTSSEGGSDSTLGCFGTGELGCRRHHRRPAARVARRQQPVGGERQRGRHATTT